MQVNVFTKKIAIKVFIIFIIWRVFTSFLISYAPLKAHELGNRQVNPTAKYQITNGLLKWDAHYYKKIAEQGYSNEKSGLPAFYPLYPSLLGALHNLGIPTEIAGLIINFIASYFASLFLFLIALRFFKKQEDAVFTLLLFLFFPMTVFSFALYTEALFCALAFGAFYFAMSRKWLVANILLAFSTATRFPSVILVAAIFVEYLVSIGWSYKKPLRLDKNALYFLLSPLGFVAYFIFLKNKYNDGLMMFNAYQYGWSYQKFDLNIFQTLIAQFKILFSKLISRDNGWGEAVINNALQLFYWFAALVLVTYSYLRKQLNVSMYVFVGLSLVLFVVNSNMASVGRYLLPLFPLYLIMTKIFSTKKLKPYRGLVIGIFAISAGVILTLFTNGYWVE